MGIADRDYMRQRKPERREISPWVVVGILFFVMVLGIYLAHKNPAPLEEAQEEAIKEDEARNPRGLRRLFHRRRRA